jgi:hypothetical protein
MGRQTAYHGAGGQEPKIAGRRNAYDTWVLRSL